ncbi:hypothetical protein HWV62_24274 [Athelia sp. TMB]|nr:hypothetical protein HWV62_24274 [Athelia sp. TMB]
MTQQNSPLRQDSVPIPDLPSPNKEPTTVAITSLAALASLSIDDESDSDIEPIPGGRTPYAPYPNCCRWHLTDARNQYKLHMEPSVCAPFAIRVASSNLYLPALGVISSLAGNAPHTVIHTPLISLADLSPPSSPLQSCTPPRSLPPTPEIEPSTLPTIPSSSPSISRRCSMPLFITPRPPPKVVKYIEVATRWFAITKGREIGVFQGWKATRPLVDDLADSHVYWCATQDDAQAVIENAISKGDVQLMS